MSNNITSVNDFLTKINDLRRELEKEFEAKDWGKLNFFYRGEDSYKYDLVPPIYRREDEEKLYQGIRKKRY